MKWLFPAAFVMTAFCQISFSTAHAEWVFKTVKYVKLKKGQTALNLETENEGKIVNVVGDKCYLKVGLAFINPPEEAPCDHMVSTKMFDSKEFQAEFKAIKAKQRADALQDKGTGAQGEKATDSSTTGAPTGGGTHTSGGQR